MPIGTATMRINYQWQEICRCGPYGSEKPRHLTPAQNRRIRKRLNKSRGFALAIYDEWAAVRDDAEKG